MRYIIALASQPCVEATRNVDVEEFTKIYDSEFLWRLAVAEAGVEFV